MAHDTAPVARTTNATPQTINGSLPQLEEDQLLRSTLFVFANDHGSGQAYWEFRVLLRRMVGAQTLGTFTQIVKNNTPSAAAWTAVGSVAANGQVVVTITGAAGMTIDWLATGEDAIGMLGAFTG